MENIESEDSVKENIDNDSKESETSSSTQRSDLLGFEDSSMTETRNSSTEDFSLMEGKSTSTTSNSNFNTNSRNASNNSITDFEEVSIQTENADISSKQIADVSSKEISVQNSERIDSGQPTDNSVQQTTHPTNSDDFSSFETVSAQQNTTENSSEQFEFTDFGTSNDFTDFAASSNDDFDQNFVSSNDANDFDDFSDFTNASTDFSTSNETPQPIPTPALAPTPIPIVPSTPLFNLDEQKLREKLIQSFQEAFGSHSNWSLNITDSYRLKNLTQLIEEQQQSRSGASKMSSHANEQGLFGLSKHCISIKNNLMASIAEHLSMGTENPGSPLRVSRTSTSVEDVDIAVDQNMSEDELNRQAATRSLLINQILNFELDYGKKLEDIIKIVESISGTERPSYWPWLESIYSLHCKLVQNIKQRMTTWDRELNADRIGDIFLQMTTSLDCYQYYRKYFGNTANVESFINDPKLKNTLQEIQLSVNDFKKLLNAPNERIAQYIVQLEDLAANTQKAHEDYHLITYACELLKTLQNSAIDQDLDLPQNPESSKVSAFADLRKMFITKDSGMAMTNEELNKLSNKLMEKITELSIELTKELDLKDVQERQKEEKTAKVKDLLESTNIQPQNLKLQSLKLST